MRFTNPLFAQHLGWMFKKHWQVQGRRTPLDTGAIAELEKHGIPIDDVNDILNPKIVHDTRLKFEKSIFPEVSYDETHPDWHHKICHIYADSNVLLQGLTQAQVLTKTIEIVGFPKNVEETLNKVNISSTVDRNIRNSILASHVFDAEQVILPKVKIPERPAFNLPRLYGISRSRRSRLLVNKLLFECEKLAGRSVTSRRKIIENADFIVSVEKDNDLVQFKLSADTFIASTRPIESVKARYEGEIPDLYPIKHTVTIPKNHIYSLDNFYAINSTLQCSHPHTIFSHFDSEFVKNLHATPVTPIQFQGRTMLKAFAVAAARAKQLYGNETKKLPKPIVVQSIQTDGRSFHLGIFQLNTLALNSTSEYKNYWFHEPSLDLFTECAYKDGQPILEGYNKDVFRYIYAFYSNT